MPAADLSIGSEVQAFMFVFLVPPVFPLGSLFILEVAVP